ncbi:hypothetical protein ES288_D03G087600v1 [Gossypium darwinii]|uniref:Uncharacterized protein n=1 Tax=Gossypium darwinii TaxID=34276 RepID=A0A5D2D2F8_GOSDA|nr:hypothetical protein ES288_D03G087600v1 [Gossypium darwinii]
MKSTYMDMKWCHFNVIFFMVFFYLLLHSIYPTNPSQHLSHATMIDCFSGLKVAPNCYSPFPFLNAPIRSLEKYPKIHKNAFNF